MSRAMPPTCETHPIVMWELTRACDLHCSACTIGATERRGTNELSTYEAYKTIDQIADLAPREFIITGGDPLERDDVVQIVDYARRRGLDPALVVSPTTGLSANAIVPGQVRPLRVPAPVRRFACAGLGEGGQHVRGRPVMRLRAWCSTHANTDSHLQATGGILMSDKFNPRLTPWHIDESEFYELESFAEEMRFLLRYAVLAPSGHNRQPWAFRITESGVEVFADYSRRLPIVDPADRELVMSVGAAITNFRVAAAHFGFDTTVVYEHRPEERIPIAVIAVAETCAPDKALAALFRAIPKRHTNRAPFDGQPIDPCALSRVCDVIDGFPETLRLILSHDRHRVADMVDQAARVQMARPAFRAEIADWIRPDDDQHTDGLRGDVLGVSPALTAPATWLLRQFDAGPWQAPRDRRLAESASALLLVTAENDRASLIGAGEALEILLLTIADAGLQYSFLNQPVEVDAMRERIRTLAGASQPAQLLIRIGSGPAVEQAMPRRQLERVVALAE